MDFENILTLLSNYAFPIVCCIYLFYSSAKERESHKEEMQKVTEALHNNTNALIKLEEIIRGK